MDPFAWLTEGLAPDAPTTAVEVVTSVDRADRREISDDGSWRAEVIVMPTFMPLVERSTKNAVLITFILATLN